MKIASLRSLAAFTGMLALPLAAGAQQTALDSGTLSGFSSGVMKGNADPSPGAGPSAIDFYAFQDEQLNLDANAGNVRVLRTNQKALVNDFITKTYPTSKVDVRELRQVLKTILGLEGGRAEVIKDKNTGESFVQVICPKFMIPYLDKAIPALDEEWVREFDTGAGDTYYKARNRGAADIDFIATNYASDNGFSVVDTTNNAVSVIDEPYRIENYVKGAQTVDIPANQALIEVKIVEVTSNNDLKLGLDYINWKKGPGRNLLHFLYEGVDAQTRAENFTSIFDPFRVGGEAAGSGEDLKLLNDYDQFYRSANYLLTSNYVDFLQVKGEARVITEEKLMVKSANTATISAEDVIVALVSAPGDLLDVEGESYGIDGEGDYNYRNDDNGSVYQVPVTDSDRVLCNRPAGSAGLFLAVTPFIGTESMELVISLSDANVHGLAPNGQPIINTRDIETTVRLRDGEPYVISGLKRKHDIKETAKAPGLGDIPVLGYLFGGENDIKRQTDVIVVLTPHVYLASQADIMAPASVKTLAGIVDGGAVSLPEGSIGYDQWLFDD
jgi:Flp pilus assembly secretin CpaC